MQRRILLLENKGYGELSPADCGDERCESCHTFGPYVRNYYLIHFIRAGKGRFTTPRGSYELSAGDAFLILPGEVTTYRADKEDPWSYIWVGFTGRLAERFAELGDVFSARELDAVRELEYTFSLTRGREEYVTGVLFKLYAALFGERTREDHPRRAATYIDAHYMEDITVSDLADMLSLDRKYLSRIFRERFGITMQEYLIERRLCEARRLLLAGYTVGESARMCGYADQFTFSRAFKKRHGYPPSSARRAE